MRFAAVLLLSTTVVFAGEPAQPNPNPQPQPHPVQPKPPIQVSAQPVSTAPAPVTTDWTQHMNDFQSDEPAKQAAAEKAFLDAGARGVPVLDMLAKKNKDLEKRVTAL